MDSTNYKLPGTNFVQTNDKSDNGNCLFTAIGNALLSRRDDDLMGSQLAISGIITERKNPRNLQMYMRQCLAVVIDEVGVKEVLEANPGLWTNSDLGIKTLKNYKDLHILANSDRHRFGTTLDIHLLALCLAGKGIRNRVIVHTKGTDSYMLHHPLGLDMNLEYPTLRQTKVDPTDILASDIVLVNTGNTHWSRAEEIE